MKYLRFLLGLMCLLFINSFSFSCAQVMSDHAAISTDSVNDTDSIQMSLEAIYRLAEQESKVIRISEQSLHAAQEAVRQAKNNILPEVSIDLSGSYIGDAYLMSRGFSTNGMTEVILPGLGPQQVSNGRQPSPHWGNMLSVQATQVIYSGGALTAGVEMAKIGEQIAELDVRKNRQEVRFMLTGYYLDMVRLLNQLEVIDVHIALTQEVLQQMQAKERAGVVLHNDLTRYELQLKQLELTRIQLQDALSVIRHQLQTALHQPSNHIFMPDTAAVAQAYMQLENSLSELAWQNTAADKNITIRQAQAVSEMSEQQVRLTRAASIPTIAAVIKNELFGPYTTDLIPVNANVYAWFVGIGIHYDLGSAWKNHRAIRQSKAESEKSKTEVELVREQVNNQIHAAYVSFLTSFTEVDTNQKQVELADENYAVVEKRYNHDLALLTDLLDASGIKLQADMALVNAKVNLLYNYYKLRYLTHSL
ncbi:MAG: TolC family protein [Paludibacteraceae bacterium]|nr:TolC family protein [Paludibacteraceae bacterium]